MKVQEVYLENKTVRYMLVKDNGFPEITACKYLKYLDKRSLSPNTQKTYCQCLKSFFTYLEEKNLQYFDVSFETLADFVNWLKNPYSTGKVIGIEPMRSKKSAKTINLIITVVTGYYDYLYRSDMLNTNMAEKLMKKVYSGGGKTYKSFLHHVSKGLPSNKNILKAKETKKKLKVLNKEQVEKAYFACNNLRDKFLIRLLFETGLRIGEALSLRIEDFIYDHKKGHKIRLVNRGELPNKAFLKTGEREIFISQELMDMFDEYEYEVLDELDLDNDFVFVKLAGKNKGQPLEYDDVRLFFKRLSKRTNIPIHAHILRHTHATVFYQKTKDIKQVQERLGHSQIQTTMDLYLHPSDEDIRKEWENAKDEFIFKGDKT